MLAIASVVAVVLADHPVSDAPAPVPEVLEPGTADAYGMATGPPAEARGEIQRAIDALKKNMADTLAKQRWSNEQLADWIRAAAPAPGAEPSPAASRQEPPTSFSIVLFLLVSGVALMTVPTFCSWFGVIQGHYLISTVLLPAWTSLKEHGRPTGLLSGADLDVLQLGVCLVCSKECHRLSGIITGAYFVNLGLYIAWLAYTVHGKSWFNSHTQ
jgi:hypothetical protein